MPDPSTPQVASGAPLTSTAAEPPPAPDTAIAGPAVQQPDPDNSETRVALILEALDAGTSYAEIQERYRCSPNTIAAIARQARAFERGIVPKLMARKSLRMLDAWEAAAVNGAKRGKHAPARDWLLHAGDIEPLRSEADSGAKVAVIIGMPGAPVQLPSVQVIDSAGDTHDQSE